MKYIFLSLAIAGTCFSTCALAQNEQWDTYMVKSGNAPSSVLVDLGLLPLAPDKRYPFLVITGPKTKNCNTMGLIDKEEIGVLEEMLEATGNFLTGVTPKILAGTVTRNCQRINYYYVKDTAGVRTALNRLYTRSFKNNAYVLGIKADPEWVTYRKFLYPDEETHNWMDNDKIIARMLQQGDSLKTPRNISFSICFRSDTDRAAFIAFATLQGYKVAAQKAIAAIPDMPYVAEATINSLVKMELVNTKSMELKIAARKYFGFYYGWETK